MGEGGADCRSRPAWLLAVAAVGKKFHRMEAEGQHGCSSRVVEGVHMQALAVEASLRIAHERPAFD